MEYHVREHDSELPLVRLPVLPGNAGEFRHHGGSDWAPAAAALSYPQ